MADLFEATQALLQMRAELTLLINEKDEKEAQQNSLEYMEWHYQIKYMIYLIVVSEDINDLIDVNLKKFHSFIPQYQLFQPCTELTGDYHFVGFLETKYKKVQLLVHAIACKHHGDFGKRNVETNELLHVDMDYISFGKELNTVLLSVIKPAYRPAVKYLEGLPHYGEISQNNYNAFISKRYDPNKQMHLSKFANFTILFVVIGWPNRTRHIDNLLKMLLKEMHSSKALNMIMLDNIEDTITTVNGFFHIKEQAGAYISARSTFKVELNDSQLRTINALKKSTLYREDKLTEIDGFWRFLYALFTGHIHPKLMNEKDSTNTYIESWKEATRYNDEDGVSAERLVMNLKVSEITNDIAGFKDEFSFEYYLLKYYQVNVETLLSHTKIYIGDLYSIYLSYLTSVDKSDHTLRIFTSPLSDNEYKEYPYLYELLSISDGFYEERDFFTRGIILVSMMKQFRFFSNSVARSTLEEIMTTDLNGGDNTKSALSWQLREQNNQMTHDIQELQQKLDAQKMVNNELELKAIQSKYKEGILTVKLEAAEMALEEYHEKEIFANTLNELEMASEVNKAIEVKETKVTNSFDALNQIKPLHIMIVGGHSNFHSAIRNNFPNTTICIESRNYNYDLEKLTRQDIVVFVASYNNHGQFERVKEALRAKGLRKKMMLINRQPAPARLAQDIWAYYEEHLAVRLGE